ncbi:MAG: LytR/AlgR family response regulator transcription factor [Eisenbergiella sp.]
MPLLGLYEEKNLKAADCARREESLRAIEGAVQVLCAGSDKIREEAETDGTWETVRAQGSTGHLKRAGEQYGARFENSEVFLEKLDALILHMPEGAGAFLTAERIWEQRKELPVIFVANSPEEVFAALSYPFFHVVRGYALEQDLEAALCKLNRIRRSVGAGMRSFVCRSIVGGKQETEAAVRVSLRDILYIQRRRHEIWVHCRTEVFITDQTLSYWEEELKKAGFIRVHKSFLVNLYHVRRLGRESVGLDSGDELLVSRYRYPEVKIRFEDYLRRAEFF